MISLILPPKDDISRAAKMLGDEFGTAQNIKSRVNRLSVLGAIKSTQERLKLYHRVPKFGLVVYCGTILTDENKEKKVTIDFEPFKPINTTLYLCDNKFHTEALTSLLQVILSPDLASHMHFLSRVDAQCWNFAQCVHYGSSRICLPSPTTSSVSSSWTVTAPSSAPSRATPVRSSTRCEPQSSILCVIRTLTTTLYPALLLPPSPDRSCSRSLPGLCRAAEEARSWWSVSDAFRSSPSREAS
jgi:hypothetical protein